MDQFRDSQRDKTDALLRDLGADDVVIERVTLLIDNDEVQGVVKKLRAFAQENPAVVLGALSALIAGGAVAAGVAAKKSSNKAKRTASRKASKKAPKAASRKRKASAKRTLIEPHPGDKRYVRRDAKGRIKESVDVGRSLSADARRHSKKKAKPGSGDKGDR
jgi:hypothetical protein